MPSSFFRNKLDPDVPIYRRTPAGLLVAAGQQPSVLANGNVNRAMPAGSELLTGRVLTLGIGNGSLFISGVSGTLTHGSSLTISGSGFGTKPTAAPLKYDDFQTVTAGAQISTSSAPGPTWGTSGTHKPLASTANLRAGTPFAKNMRCRWSHPGGDDNSNIILTGQAMSQIIVDAWMYVDTTSTSGMTNAGGGTNIKHIRAHQASAGSPNAGFTSEGPFPNQVNAYALAGDGRAVNNVRYLESSTDIALIYNAWAHIQWLIDVGSGGTSTNGKNRMYINGALKDSYDSDSLLNTGLINYPELYLGNYARSSDAWTGDLYTDWESMYVDSSWARVEIGNNPVYSNCTQREIQIPSAWSGTGTSITVTANRGSFASLSGKYLFVVKSDNTPSAGYAL